MRPKELRFESLRGARQKTCVPKPEKTQGHLADSEPKGSVVLHLALAEFWRKDDGMQAENGRAPAIPDHGDVRFRGSAGFRRFCVTNCRKPGGEPEKAIVVFEPNLVRDAQISRAKSFVRLPADASAASWQPDEGGPARQLDPLP